MAGEHQTTILHILDFADPQSEYERVRQALRQCLDVLEDEFRGYGPREPETTAIRTARAALAGTP